MLILRIALASRSLSFLKFDLLNCMKCNNTASHFVHIIIFIRLYFNAQKVFHKRAWPRPPSSLISLSLFSIFSFYKIQIITYLQSSIGSILCSNIKLVFLSYRISKEARCCRKTTTI